MSAPTAIIRAAVYERDGKRCVACHTIDALTFQHRRAVGMGGSKVRPGAADGVTACLTCNGEFERSMIVLALAYGWKAEKWTNPTEVPVYYPHEFQWHRLDGVTRRPVSGVVALDMMHAVYGDKYMHWYSEAKS